MRKAAKNALMVSVDLASVKTEQSQIVMQAFQYLILFVALNYPFKLIISALLFPFLVSAIIATFEFPIGIGYVIVSIANTIFWYTAFMTKLQNGLP